MPAQMMEVLSEALRHDSHSLIGIANDVAHAATLERAQPRISGREGLGTAQGTRAMRAGVTRGRHGG